MGNESMQTGQNINGKDLLDILMRELRANGDKDKLMKRLIEVLESKIISEQIQKKRNHLIVASCCLAFISVIVIALAFGAILGWPGTEKIAATGFIFGAVCLALILINAIFALVVFKAKQ